jgi:hypothetical protein
MDAGTRVYRANIYDQTAGSFLIDEGRLAGTMPDGIEYVRFATLLVPMDERWHTARGAALSEVAIFLVRKIGEFQARLDTLRDEILHTHLTAEEVAK